MKKLLLMILLLASTAFGMHTGVMQIPVGAKDVSLQVKMYDPGDDGTLEPGLTVTDFDLYYIRVEKDNDVTIDAKADMTALNALTDAHTDDYAYEIGQGYYRIDVPDGAFAAGATRGAIIVSDDGAAALTTTIDFELVGSIHEIYVAKSGFNYHSGHTFEDALLTVAQAITNASAGDKIIIHPGTYAETISVGKKLCIVAAHPQSVSITSGGITVGGSGSYLQDLTFSGTTSAALTFNEADDVTCVRVEGITTGIDGFYCIGTPERLRLIDCHGKSGYDGVQLGASKEAYIKGGLYESTGSGASAVNARAITDSAGCRGAVLEDVRCYCITDKDIPVIGIDINEEATIINPTIIVDRTGGSGADEITGIKSSGTDARLLVINPNIVVKPDDHCNSYGIRVVQGKITVVGGSIRSKHTAIKSSCTAQVSGNEKDRFRDHDDTFISAMANDFFNSYWVLWLTGNNTGETKQVDTFVGGDDDEFQFAAEFTNDIEIGDEYIVYQNLHYDLHVTSGKYLRVTNLGYDEDLVSGTVLQGGGGWAAAINAEMDTTFNTAVPASPTADSINERIAAIDGKLPSASYLMGSADSDGGFDTAAKADINSETDGTFDTALPESPTAGSANDYLKRILDRVGRGRR